MKKVIYVLATFAFLMSCSNESTIKLEPAGDSATSNLAAGSLSEEEIKLQAEKRKQEQEAKEKERKANETTMEITPAVHDFGVIAKETPVSKTFTIKNTGDKPLIINDAQASCGCTVPKKPEEPIMPGQTGELEVTFTSNKGQAGQAIDKTVTVTANIPSQTQKITIKAQVEN